MRRKSKIKAGFIGLGTMGSAMAQNLLRSGMEVAVFDSDVDKLEDFWSIPNCRIASSPMDAAIDADYFFTMLPDSEVVEEVLFGENGAVLKLREKALIIEMSTGSPVAFQDFRKRLHQQHIRIIDAPVGRTPGHAKRGDLLVLVGADEETLDEIRPLLECFGKDIVLVGPPGHAIRLKIVNNYMSMVGMVLTAETLLLAKKAGIDRDIAVKVLQSTTAGKGQINVNFPRKVLAGDISPDFPLSLGLKDISLAVELAKAEGAPLFLGGAARELFALAKPWGRSQQDCTAMLLLLEDLARSS
jgi:4-hydroxybutyrate dehydrogenase/sulfolactaldehyde 3-reductase